MDLESALKDVRALYDREGRTAVPPDVAVKAWGYKSLSGVARTRLAALKQYGLVHWAKTTVRVTDRALTLMLREPASREWENAVRAAALEPEIFRELSESWAEASDDALRTYLIRDKSFTQDGASRLISSFRATVTYAKLDGGGYTTEPEEEGDQSEGTPLGGGFAAIPEGERRAGARAVQLPISQTKWAVLQAVFPLTNAEWKQMLSVLEAMKPALVAPNSISDPTEG
jgi:hypothetical protein